MVEYIEPTENEVQNHNNLMFGMIERYVDSCEGQGQIWLFDYDGTLADAGFQSQEEVDLFLNLATQNGWDCEVAQRASALHWYDSIGKYSTRMLVHSVIPDLIEGIEQSGGLCIGLTNNAMQVGDSISKFLGISLGKNEPFKYFSSHFQSKREIIEEILTMVGDAQIQINFVDNELRNVESVHQINNPNVKAIWIDSPEKFHELNSN